ncbi:PrmA domain-containing protein [Cephalotus follicularis]|uniref:ETFB lysine methyltransferase n=1 Tax=Cephalotus follicularis TaxID=3775 RepID=A0A1Q3BWZ5_CEPFO|nr:PrmA domain-containing protein [Cephalotus follicularis]
MAVGHFFKHLSFTLSRRSMNPYRSQLILYTGPLSLTHCKQRHELTTPTSTKPTISLSSVHGSINSSYLSVRIRCPKHVADTLSEALLCFGASSTSMDEEDGCKNSDEICIDSTFPEFPDVGVCISQAADSIGLKEIPKYEIKMGGQNDWIKKYLESFHPVEVTEGLWVVPEWRTPPDVQATNIILNPKLAFGTGEHPTTVLCLLLLQGLIKGDEVFLDYGTGSGILAIAALKFGAALSVGIDIDPQAIESARYNAALNNIEYEKMQLHLVPGQTCPPSMHENGVGKDQTSFGAGPGLMPEKDKYDVVIANILLNPLLELAEHIVSCAKPGAVIGISGILSEQLPYIIDRYSQYLEGISVSEMDDWACVSGSKKRNL